MKLAPLFLVSLTAVGVETALTRYFAAALWSDYGYWVISIVMAGFAFSGVTIALSRDFLILHSRLIMTVLPPALIACAGLGYAGVILNPFNPLQLQNQVTYLAQLANIGMYYLALLPFFYLTGLFVALSFIANAARINAVYAADLTGAGLGAAVVLALMYVCSPFALIPALLPALALAALLGPAPKRAGIAALAILLGVEILLAVGPQGAISQYKPIYPPLHTPGAKILARMASPRGDYLLLDDFTERVNTDISNDAGMLGYPDPPRSYGLYRDGVRIASLPMPGAGGPGYAPGALDALPYRLIPHAGALLLGASGGFRITELLALGAARVRAVEPEPVLYAALRRGLANSPPLAVDPRVHLTRDPPAAVRGHARYDVIDISADFMDAAPANAYAFTAEAFTADLRVLTPGGILSIPVSIEDFPAYALRMLATARSALAAAGIADPAAHVIIYRSAWNARLLLSPAPFSPAELRAAAKWCDDRSFDVSYYDGINPAALRANLYNDLPAVSFDAGTITASGPDDSIADEAGAILAGRPTPSAAAFNLSAVTNDRPAFYAILRLGDLSLLLARLQILPQPEIGALINLAVLAQAALIALFVLAVPLVAPRISARAGIGRSLIYFPALAVGFLFIEIFAIEKASVLLDDRAAGFALVLGFMLVFSGLGALASGRFRGNPAGGVRLTCLIVALWATAALVVLLPAGIAAGAALPFSLRAALVVIAIAPVAFALGLPFPLGLGQVSGSAALAWAWGLNGAFSIVATPLAALLARNAGFNAILAGAVLSYAAAAITVPAHRRRPIWLTSAPSPAAD